jgi:serine/threonine protein kinase
MADFFGRFNGYYLKKLIGQGGMGQVYLADDLRWLREVALKIMNEPLARESHFRRRFLQEMAITQRLAHPAIVPVWYAQETNLPQVDYPVLYLVMEYAAGGSLEMRLKQMAFSQAPLAAGAAVRLVVRLAEALDYAHQQGVIHLDIKPGNILLRQEGDLENGLLADFGLSQLLHQEPESVTKPFVGTPGYMSPEQLQGEKVDGRSDLFSLGVVLYQLVAGHPPFPAASPVAVDRQQRAGPPPLPDVNPALVEIIETALALNPAARFQTGGDLASALRHYLQKVDDVGVTDTTSTVPVIGGTVVTRLQARHWTPAVSISSRINFKQRWLGGPYRIFIAHQMQSTRIVNVSDDQRILRLGRDEASNDIVLADPHVSGRHATLERVGNGWQILDEGSINGVYLRQQERLTPHKPHYWRGREVLQIGPYFLVWEAYDKFGLNDEQAEKAYKREANRWDKMLATSNYWLQPEREDLLAVTLLPPTEALVKPGEQAVLQATIANREAIVERVQVRLEDIPDAWYTTPPAGHSLLSGSEKPLTVLIHPPLLGEATSGRHTCDVVIYSTVNGRERFRQRNYVIKVAQVAGHTWDLHPKNIVGPGRVQVSVLNTGNAEASYIIQARDPADAILFSDSERLLIVPPGQRQYVDLTLTARERRPFFPPSRLIPFEIRAAEQGAEPQVLGGQMMVKPRFPGWLLIAALLSVVILWLVVPPVVSRHNARVEMKRAAQAEINAATAALAEAEAAIAINQALIDSLTGADPDRPALAQLQENLRQAEADKAAAAAALAQAEEQAAAADAMGLIGPAIPANRPPTGLLLDNDRVPENSPPGTLVGILVATDPDENDTHTFRLVAGDGDEDNALFAIAGSRLNTLGDLDYESQEELSVRIEAKDSRGETIAQRFTILVLDVNEPPTDIELSQHTIPENAPGAELGRLTTIDPDRDDSHTYTIVSDPTGLFEISGDVVRLRSGEALDFENEESPFDLEIASEDDAGHRITAVFAITIEDKNDPPLVRNFGLSGPENEEIAFSQADFVDHFFDEDEGHELVQVKIMTLPVGGLLMVGEEQVYEGQELTVAQLDLLVFRPNPNWYGVTTLNWNGSDGELYAVEAGTVTLTITPVPFPPSFFFETTTITVLEDAGPQNVNWATDIRSRFDNRNLSFLICQNSNPDLFSQPPHVNASSGHLMFTPAPDQNGTAELIIILSDGEITCDNAEESADITIAEITIEVTPVNDAPVLHCFNMNPPALEEGRFSPLTVAQIIDLGGPNCITDVDGPAVKAMAVIGLLPRPAVWEYSLDGGATWRDFPANVSHNRAVLLSAEARLRLKNPKYYGPAGIQYHAWDRSIGQSGDENVNILQTGGTTAFSDNVATVNWTINPVNDPPQIILAQAQVACAASMAFMAPAGRLTDADDLGDGQFAFNDGYLEAAIVAGPTNLDTLRLVPDQQGGLQVSGAGVTFNGISIGTIDAAQNGRNGTTLRIRLNENATVAAATAVLQRLAYEGPRCQTTVGAAAGSFAVGITFNDGGNVGSDVGLADNVEVMVTR